mmetsp:Transcript_9551/g.8405  ORF Transcript_9551/g.8405 Transcript_9551/m.8405 type:complete len:159 (+) Transcript_9551:505-981(+)
MSLLNLIDQENQLTRSGFKAREFDKNDFSEIKGVPYIQPKKVTKARPFNLSLTKDDNIQRSHWGYDGHSEEGKQEHSANNLLKGKPQKRRSRSQNIDRKSKENIHHGYRVTFSSKEGRISSVPMRTTMRAESRCIQTCCNLYPISEHNIFKARVPNYK